MKAIVLLAFLGLVVPFEAVRLDTSPVSRVVELLNKLASTIQSELKTEEGLYDKYVCWAETIINSKTASNAAARAREEDLNTYIANIDAGKIEFTTERQDLEKELADIKAGISAADQARAKEHEDYLAAKDEMTKAVSALQQAIAVLSEATEGNQASLFALRSTVNEGFRARMAEADSLKRAVDVGNRYLSKGDAHFLSMLLTGEVPSNDWKHLNSKATFKMSYKTRSGKIQGTLERLLAHFEKNLQDTESKEAKALALYNELNGSKQEQLSKTEEALQLMVKETGARELSRSEAAAEVEALQTQVTNDERYISQTQTSLEAKKKEWADREALRMSEIEAINKAISILHGDDARDLFKKSFASQGYMLIQIHDSDSSMKKQRGSAAEVLRAISKKTKDTRLAVLASTIAQSRGPFDAVIEAIDTMLTTLKAEEDDDLAKKQQCEENRMQDTREAITTGREMDDLTDEITRLEGEIEVLAKEIEEKEEEIKKIQEQLEEAEKMRTAENAEWQVANQEDAEAVTIVGAAINVLRNFYQENGLSLLDKHHHQRQAPTIEAGEAPPPPPPTWEAPYAGQQEESHGIIAILEMIQQDIEKDSAKAKAAEDQAEADYQTFVTESNAQIDTLNESITSLTEAKGQKEEDVVTAKESRNTKKESLDIVMKRIKDAKPGCDFYLINYGTRLADRQAEIDGLNKAKGILQSYVPEAPAPAA